MKKRLLRYGFPTLTQAVLASTVLLSPLAQATLVVTGVNSGSLNGGATAPIACPVDSTTTGSIEITSSGQLALTCSPSLVTDNASLTIDPLVAGGIPIAISITGNPAISATNQGTNIGSPPLISIGAGRTVVGTIGLFVSDGSINIVNNSGTIQSSTNTGIMVSTNSPSGVITNYLSGTIETMNTGPAAFLMGGLGVNISSIVNIGTMTNNSTTGLSGTITVNLGSITQGINNSGTIQNLAAASVNTNAIYMTTGRGQITNSGTITGNIYLGTVTSPLMPVFIMNSGTNSVVTGNIYTVGGAVSSILNLNGGQITGTGQGVINLNSTAAAGDHVNLQGTIFNAIVGVNAVNNTIEVVSGGAVTSAGSLITNVPIIIVDSGADFQSNSVITGLTTLTLNGTMEAYQSVNTAATAATDVILNNQLTIETPNGSFNAIAVDVNSSGGSIVNEGTITTTLAAPALLLAGNISGANGITNASTGTISNNSAANATITSSANTNVSNGIVNLGTITNNNTPTNPAIDLSAASTLAALFQEGGTITGTVILAPSGGTVFNMSGGTIAGNITASTNPSPFFIPNTLILSGGSNLSGTGPNYILTLGDNGDTVVLSGATMGTINGGAGNDIVDYSAGSYVLLDGMGNTGGSGNILLFNNAAPLTVPLTATTQNMQTVEVNGPGAVTLNGPVGINNATGVQTLTAGAPLTVNNTISGTATTTSTFITSSDFTLNAPNLPLPGGVLTNFNTLIFNGTTLLNGSIPDFQNIDINGVTTQAGSVSGTLATSKFVTTNTYELQSGGTIDNVNLIDFGGNATIDQGGAISVFNILDNEGDLILNGSITGIAGTSIVNTSGDFSITSTGVLTQLGALNISGTLEQAGTLNTINAVDVQNHGVFTINNTVSNIINSFTIDSGGSTIVNANLTGTANLQNNGSMTINSDGFVNLTGATSYTGSGTLTLAPKSQPGIGVADSFNMVVPIFHEQTGGVMNVTIANAPVAFSAIQVTAGPITFEAGTKIVAIFLENTFTPNGSVFPIVQGGAVVDQGVVVSTNSLIPYFVKMINGTQFDLVLERNRIPSLGLTNPIALSIAPVIQEFIDGNGLGNAEIENLIVQLDNLTTIAQLTNALVALSPDVSYGMIQGAHIGMDRTFGILWQRLEDIQQFRGSWYGGHYKPSTVVLGYNAGDPSSKCPNSCPYGIWVAPYGEWANQYQSSYNEGYKADAYGIAVGYDRTFQNGTVLGAAGSFTRVHVVGSFEENNVQEVGSLQGTLYGFWQPFDAVYIDLMFGIASNKFQNSRNINIGNIDLSAFSSFYGWQYGGQFDVGYVDCETDFYIVPIGRIKATYLHMQSFVEDNAGSLGLSTHERALPQFLAGAGLRLAKQIIDYPYSYVPEFTVMYMYDFSDKAQQTVANFIGGGTAFPTIGVRPPRNVLLLDLAVEAYAVEDKTNVVTLRYECELREKFSGNSGFIEFYHRWF